MPHRLALPPLLASLLLSSGCARSLSISEMFPDREVRQLAKRALRSCQSMFANRINRYRLERGHVFQGRYKALIMPGLSLVRVCDYIGPSTPRAPAL